MLVLGSYQTYATIKLFRYRGYSTNQKIVQALLIWFLPLIGALIVTSVINFTERGVRRGDERFWPNGGGSPPGI